MDEKETKLAVAEIFIVKASLVSYSLSLDDDFFLEMCANIFHAIEKDTSHFTKLEQLADLIEICPHSSVEDLEMHRNNLQLKLDAIDEKLKKTKEE
jgi:hypothetical protein